MAVKSEEKTALKAESWCLVPLCSRYSLTFGAAALVATSGLGSARTFLLFLHLQSRAEEIWEGYYRLRIQEGKLLHCCKPSSSTAETYERFIKPLYLDLTVSHCFQPRTPLCVNSKSSRYRPAQPLVAAAAGTQNTGAAPVPYSTATPISWDFTF